MANHQQEVEQYVDDVISGRIVTGRLARLAVWRYLDDLKLATKRGFYFDQTYAEEFLDFCETCCFHTQAEWAGMPFIPSPWQKFIDWNLFGWRRDDNGCRRFTKDYEELGRKNGKTSRCSPKCFYLSLMDNPIENGSQGYCVATKEDQAKLLFNEVVRCREKSETLKRYSHAYEKRMTFAPTQSYMQVLGSDSDSQDGFNPHFIVRDELHAWRERHRGLAEKLNTGFGSRRQPLMITITTAGDKLSKIWKEEHDYAVKVLESVITGQIIDDTFFAYIAAIDRKPYPCFRCQGKNCTWCGGTGELPIDDHFDESCWIKANPNLGVSVKLDKIRSLANMAKHKPTAENELLRYHCNVEVSASERLIAPEAWEACKGQLSDLRHADRIHGGIDLGRSNDFAGVAIVSKYDMVDDDGKEFSQFQVRGRAWTCLDRPEEVQTEQIAGFVRDGDLSECHGDQILISDVEDWVVEQSKVIQVATWAYDRTFALQFAQRLQEVHGLTVFPFTQAPKFYNETVRTLERIVREVHKVNGKPVRALVHDGDPVLAWMITNLIVVKNAKDEWMPDKGASTEKIDLAVATLMAISECMFSEEAPTQSIYDREYRGFIGIS